MMLDPSVLQSQIQGKITQEKKTEMLQANYQEEKKNLLYLLLFESVLSNWQYITYFLMVLEHVRNMGLLTALFPLTTFLLGIPHSYQAPKTIWRLGFIILLFPILIKFVIGIGLIDDSIVDKKTIFLLIGDNLNSITVEYLLVISIIVQSLILKVVGLYDQTAAEV